VKEMAKPKPSAPKNPKTTTQNPVKFVQKDGKGQQRDKKTK
jgi:hypothetical protein